ncbi:MAG: hypothetical protein M1826_002979 [Phylliscum demangeonii]|nr:MAG: hypothetical protein M1826_002979 [Phylliscum demangeonii]
MFRFFPDALAQDHRILCIGQRWCAPGILNWSYDSCRGRQEEEMATGSSNGVYVNQKKKNVEEVAIQLGDTSRCHATRSLGHDPRGSYLTRRSLIRRRLLFLTDGRWPLREIKVVPTAILACGGSGGAYFFAANDVHRR